MKCHVIAPFHTIPDPDGFSHDAFAQKALKLVKMLVMAGYEVIEYANEGSRSVADEKVVILGKDEYDKYYPPLGPGEFHVKYANVAERGAPLFRSKCEEELSRRVSRFDIVCHTFGHASSNLLPIAPNAFHVESGIGYHPCAPFGCFRIFESEAWRHWAWGRYHDQGERYGYHYSWVIPNTFDVNEWPAGAGDGDYILFMGRVTPDKGMATITDLAKALPDTTFKVAGQGNFDQWLGGFHNVKYLGSVTGFARAGLVGKARCMLMPTDYIEPFGSSGVEALMTGTPLVSVDYGAFTETVIPGINGFRCKTLADWLEAIDNVGALSRASIARIAQNLYSLEAGAKLYKKAFTQISDLADRGWYTIRR